MTLHPLGKQGVNIEKTKYNTMKQAILEALQERDNLTFTELQIIVKTKLQRNFERSVSWYYTTVKLDLEARKIIERVPGSKPQVLRIKK